MRNELLTIGPFTVHGYGLMIAIGIIVAYAVLQHRARKINLDNDKVFNLTLCLVIGGILGAKLLFLMTQIKEIIANPALILKVSDGFVVYGGIIGGIFVGFLYCKKAKLDFLQCFDLAMPSVAIAQGFGRMGCFLAGCCYGIETDSPIGITFHQSEFAPNGVSLIPTQLIASGLDFLNFLALVLIARKKKADGQVAGFYIVFYSTGRFILEYFRGDLIRGSIGVISTSQFISIFLLIAGCILIVATRYWARKKAISQV